MTPAETLISEYLVNMKTHLRDGGFTPMEFLAKVVLGGFVMLAKVLITLDRES